MKVMCIYNKDHANEICPKIEVGDMVTVVDEKMYDGLKWYEFQEYPPKLFGLDFYRLWYAAKNFAILPDSSADEMQEENQEAIVNIETPVA